MEQIVHPIPPLYDGESRILILGSFPSVRSREGMFFYHHPQNRFWKVLAMVLQEQVPQSISEKSALLHTHHIALWDVIQSCQIDGSSDSSIRNVIPNDLTKILSAAPIQKVVCNGGTAFHYYKKFMLPTLHISAEKLPSTSPANASWSLEQLVRVWKTILD